MDRDPSSQDRLFPPIEPYRKDWLVVGDHRLYFEESGNPAGLPVLFLHGGPGSCTRPDHRRYFDPSLHRIVLFDQRGCGRSAPAGAILENTTAHLVEDIARLRTHLQVQRWMLFGGSWGSTLALAYAIAHSRTVAGMILRGVFLASREELHWYLFGMRRFIPQAWEEFAGDSGPALLESYHGLVNHPDHGVALAAARRWYAYEARMMAMGDVTSAGAAPAEHELLARVRVQLHYLANDCFLRPNELLDNLWRVAGMPVTIVQGNQDMVCPPAAAVAVAERLPGADLQLVAGGGHSASQPEMASRLCTAVARMRAAVERKAPHGA